MSKHRLPEQVQSAVSRVGRADIVVGVYGSGDQRTIAHVLETADAGLTKYFAQFMSALVSSENGRSAGPLQATSIALSGQGPPDQAGAIRATFAIAKGLGARACVLLDGTVRSITPEWLDLLLRPLLFTGYDFVAPLYRRHRYEGTLTKSILYPLTRALYGLNVDPVGADFGISARLLSRYLERDDWEAAPAASGTDLWMTTIALAERFRVCRSCLNAGLPGRRGRGMNVTDLLYRVLGNLFHLMEEYENVWSEHRGTKRAGLFGYPYEVGIDTAPLDVKPMLSALRRGCRDLSEIWSLALDRETLHQVLCLGRSLERDSGRFQFPDDLWVRVVCGFAWAHKSRPSERAYLLRSLTPLYLARIASFVLDTEDLCSADVDGRIEDLCLCFERHKPELVRNWWRRAAPSWNTASANPRASETGVVETKTC